MQPAHSEIPPGVLPSRFLSDNDIRQCGLDPVQIRQLEDELAEMGLGLGFSIGGLVRGIGRGIGRVGGAVVGGVKSVARTVAPVASFIPGPIGIAATGFQAADSMLARPGEPAPADIYPGGPMPFDQATPGSGVTRYQGPMMDVAPAGAPPPRKGRFGMSASMKRRLAAASAAAGPRLKREMGYWQHSQTGQVVTGASGIPPTREPYWKWTRTAPAQRPGASPQTEIRTALGPRGPSLEDRIRGIVGTILPAAPTVIDAITGRTGAETYPAGPFDPVPVGPAPQYAPPAASSPVTVTTGAPAAGAAMPPWLLPALIGVGALVVLPKVLGKSA